MTIASNENVRLMFKGLKLDGRTEEYVLKRMEQIDGILESILHKEIEIDTDKKGKFRVEIMIKTPYELYRAENTTQSVEGSVDLAVDDLRGQITRTKDKRRTLIKRGGRSIKKRAVIDDGARF